VKCPKCQFENPEGKKFCQECGSRLSWICPNCKSANLPTGKFCGDCGYKLEQPPETPKQIPPSESERKHVTVLFSDMSGYTAMTEKLDPEETKEIMGEIFGEISKVVAKYGGFIEKFIGDAVMALFGVPTSHEDDPVRAIKASREIHYVVSSLSSQFEKRIGKALCMHTGICTGLVVTGEVNLEKGTHGVLGDTINTAARLSGLAKPGEIVISTDTYYQSEGYFNFEALEPTTVKGKTERVKPYKVLSPKEDPTKTHRLSGMRADLIGREVEMTLLNEASANLMEGKGSVISIFGDAGTGKSRLVEEFKRTLDLRQIRWNEGNCYPYAQNIPYYPIIDLLSRVWEINEKDSPDNIRRKIQSGAESLLEDKKHLIPYLGGLYSLIYPETQEVVPEVWKARLREAIHAILLSFTRRAPCVICMEDLHWADHSSIEILRSILLGFNYPCIFICVYRSAFNLFTSHQVGVLGNRYKEIHLQDLSLSDSQDMLRSLLKTDNVPNELRMFVKDKAEGNPFFLEEAVNNLVESGTLTDESGSWNLTRQLKESDIPMNVHGIITARLDYLEKETRRILQEASVIGRAFLYDILKKITELKEYTDKSLINLERLDLVKIRSLQPDLEYMFNHALIQEAVYNGILKKERQALHERVGLVIEEIFKERLPEFYETLSFHFKQGHSTLKAVRYLMKAGEKSFSRYSLEESDRYFREAFELLTDKQNKSKEEKELLIDLLINWAIVLHHRAAFTEMINLLMDYKDIAVSLGDKTKLGMFYIRLGGAMEYSQRLKEAQYYLQAAITLGEEAKNQKIRDYARGLLVMTYADMGCFDESISLFKQAESSYLLTSDQEMFRLSFTALGVAYVFKGDRKGIEYAANTLINYGKGNDNATCLAQGYILLVWAHFLTGNIPPAIECCREALRIGLEPLCLMASKTALGLACILSGKYQEAEKVLGELIQSLEGSGFNLMGTMATGFWGVAMIANGKMWEGVNIIEGVILRCLNDQSKYRYALLNNVLGKVYLQVIEGGGTKKSLSFFAKNIGFLIKTVPFAHKKAEDHLTKAIQTATEIGAKGILAEAYFNLGQVHKIKGRTDQAKKCISDAIQLFKECEADVYLKRAREALASL
jgi:class 3 adenylate cyclase/tetratricopeptide (TPR) repeat protein